MCVGTQHTIISTSNGVYGVGYNGQGQLGIGPDYIVEINPVVIPGLSGISVVVCGESTSFFGNGTVVLGAGYNVDGQLGLGTISYASSPTVISGISSGFSQGASGPGHTILVSAGSAYSMGDNTYGQLGLNSTSSARVPTLIPQLSGVIQVTLSQFFSMVLVQGGDVYGFGNNANGQLGIQPFISSQNYLSPQLVIGITASKVACGFFYCMVLATNGTLFGAGYNNYGNLCTNLYQQSSFAPISSLPSGPINVSDVSCSFYSSFIVLQSTSGQIYTCGSNQYGQLGIENNLQNVYSPTLVSSVTGATHLTTGATQVIVINGSEIVSWGHNLDSSLGFNLSYSIPQLINSLVGVEIAQIVSSYGVETSFAIARNGTGYVCFNHFIYYWWVVIEQINLISFC